MSDDDGNLVTPEKYVLTIDADYDDGDETNDENDPRVSYTSQNITIASIDILFDKDVLISDIDEDNNKITLVNADFAPVYTLNPITITGALLEIHSIITGTDTDFDLYQNTILIENDLLKIKQSDISLIIQTSLSVDSPMVRFTMHSMFLEPSSTKEEETDTTPITLTTISDVSPLHTFKSVVRKRITDSTYIQNQIDYSTAIRDNRNNYFVFGSV